MPRVHRFGRVEVQVDERLVLVDGAPVALGGRAFDLLVALLERAGKLVTKDELLDVVWGRIIVEEANLHVHVSALRKILGAGAIATIPGRGYRFMLSASTDTGKSPPALSAAAPAAPAVPAPPAAPTAPTAPVPRPTAAPQRPPEIVGRDNDLAALLSLLDAHRLVTVAGTGGVGKTLLARTALWAARDRFPEGVALVELAPLGDPALIPGAIAAAVQSALGAAGAGEDAIGALVAAVRPLRMLVLLDNAEHLVDGVARVADALLQGDSPIQLLVTSQTPLKVRGEQVHRLAGLDVPPGDGSDIAVADALRHGAIALFEARVRAVDRNFRITTANLKQVIGICRQLDGIALAIELAAARCPLLGLETVAQHLDERFRLLRSGNRTAPDRQQTLEAAMDWSHALLAPEQQAVFRQLGVFAGGFTIALAQQVLHLPGKDAWDCIDLLADLVERSLVQVEGGDTPRYRLFETGRAYALQKLAGAGDIEATRARHAACLHNLFEAAYEECWTVPEAEFVARYEPELENLRAAMDWSQEHDHLRAVALAGASSRLWRWLSLHPEALRRCHDAQRLIDAGTPRVVAARLWEAIAQLSGEISSIDSRHAAEQALRLYGGPEADASAADQAMHSDDVPEPAGSDRRGVYLALAHLAFSYRVATAEAEAACARMREIEDPAWPAALRLYGTKVAGGLASDSRRVDEARTLNETRLALARASGSEREVNAALGNLADLALIAGDPKDAVRRGRALLANLGRRQIATRAIALGNLLLALLAVDDLPAARATLGEFVAVARSLSFMFVMYCADGMALLAAREGRFDAAAQLVGYADAAYAAQGQPREPNEAKARGDAWGLLTRQCGPKNRNQPPADLSAALAAGAGLKPDAVCALALAQSS